MTDENPDIQFQGPAPTTSNPDSYHFYEEDDSGLAALYVDGKAYCAGAWYEVTREALNRVGVKLFKVLPENLWVSMEPDDTSGYEVFPDEAMLDPATRAEALKTQRIADLQRELAALTGMSGNFAACPIGCTLLAQGIPHVHSQADSGVNVDPNQEVQQVNVSHKRGDSQ